MILDEFKEIVATGEVMAVRSVLDDYLIIDCTFQSFDEALNYAAEKLPIVEEHNNGVMNEDATKWDKQYLSHQKVALMINFSQERIEHIKKVIKVVLPTHAEPIAQSTVVEEREVGGSRTGSRVVSVEPAQRQTINQVEKNNSKTSGRTGRYTREVVVERKNAKKKGSVFSGNEGRVIAGGVMVTAIGVIAEVPLVIGIGAVATTVGVVAKIKAR